MKFLLILCSVFLMVAMTNAARGKPREKRAGNTMPTAYPTVPNLINTLTSNLFQRGNWSGESAIYQFLSNLSSMVYPAIANATFGFFYSLNPVLAGITSNIYYGLCAPPTPFRGTNSSTPPTMTMPTAAFNLPSSLLPILIAILFGGNKTGGAMMPTMSPMGNMSSLMPILGALSATSNSTGGGTGGSGMGTLPTGSPIGSGMGTSPTSSPGGSGLGTSPTTSPLGNIASLIPILAALLGGGTGGSGTGTSPTSSPGSSGSGTSPTTSPLGNIASLIPILAALLGGGTGGSGTGTSPTSSPGSSGSGTSPTTSPLGNIASLIPILAALSATGGGTGGNGSGTSPTGSPGGSGTGTSPTSSPGGSGSGTSPTTNPLGNIASLIPLLGALSATSNSTGGGTSGSGSGTSPTGTPGSGSGSSPTGTPGSGSGTLPTSNPDPLAFLRGISGQLGYNGTFNLSDTAFIQLLASINVTPQGLQLALNLLGLTPLQFVNNFPATVQTLLQYIQSLINSASTATTAPPSTDTGLLGSLNPLLASLGQILSSLG